MSRSNFHSLFASFADGMTANNPSIKWATVVGLSNNMIQGKPAVGVCMHAYVGDAGRQGMNHSTVNGQATLQLWLEYQLYVLYYCSDHWPQLESMGVFVLRVPSDGTSDEGTSNTGKNKEREWRFDYSCTC
jgi:hypothetical protein